jgi:hypothetical protein
MTLCLRVATQQPRWLVDLHVGEIHIRAMGLFSKGSSYDISHLLKDWKHVPNATTVRKFDGKDGQSKIQLRVSLGLLQMNADGRPDGQGKLGHGSVYDYCVSRLRQHASEHNGVEALFFLTSEDCAELLEEFLQYHHRYICLLELQDYEGVRRDTDQNLKIIEMVDRFVRTSEAKWSIQQFFPQLILCRTRAAATDRIGKGDMAGALAAAKTGMLETAEFYQKQGREDLQKASRELQALERWIEELTNSQKSEGS